MTEQALDNSETSNLQDASVINDIPFIDDEILDAPDFQEAKKEEKNQATDESADEEGDDAEDADKADEPTDDANLKIKVDGAEYSADEIRELAKSKANYTQQRQADAEQVRIVERQAIDIVAQAQESHVQHMAKVIASVKDFILPGVTPEALFQLAQSDPNRANSIKAQLDAINSWANQQFANLGAAQNNMRQIKQQADEKDQFEYQQMISSEAEKLGAKKWFTPEFQKQAVSYMDKHGIPQSESKNISRAGAIEIVRKAMLYDKAVSTQKSGKQPAQVGVNQGSRSANAQINQVKARQDLEKRAKSGDVNAQGRYLRTIIPEIKD